MAGKRRRSGGPLALRGAVWIAAGERDLGGPGRIALLRAIAAHGSINKAASALGMGYKTAWNAVEAMNELAVTPLVERTKGGKGGGSTKLTDHGARLVARFEEVEAVHKRMIAALDRAAMDFEREFSLLGVLNMRTSARNQWEGTVAALRAGAVNDEVEVALAGGAKIVATVTRESGAALGLRAHLPVIALVKAPAVVLATGLGDARVSAGNRYDGTVARVTGGAVNAEVVLAIDGGLEVVAVVTQGSIAALGLDEGARASALIKPSDVILAVVD